jgi:hypothetical protein
MTHQDESSVIRDLVDLAMEHGPDATAAALATLINHAMQIEPEQVLEAGLDRGVDSKQAMIFAMAEMCVQGVCARKAAAVVEELCGLKVTSTQVSCAAELDEQLDAWRNRPIGEITYLILDGPRAESRDGSEVARDFRRAFDAAEPAVAERPTASSGSTRRTSD